MCLSKQGEETVLTTLDCEGGAVESRPLAELVDDDSLRGPEAVVEPVPGGVPAVALVGAESSKYLIYRHGSGLRSFVAPLPTASSLTVTFLEEDLALHFTEPGPHGVDLQVADLLTGDLLSELSGRLDAELPAHWSISAATCGSRKGRGPGCKILFSCLDHSIALVMHPGKTVWVREEALASIIAVEMLDLPVSDTDAAIEQEFDHKESGFVGMFVHRIASQLFQLRAALLAVLGMGDSQSDGDRAGLVRDEFGLHKVIVAATASGKVFGIDNLNGEVLWQHWLEDGEPFTSGTSHKPHAVLFVQRTNRHFPKPAQCVLVLRSKATGEGLLLVFNPITGQAVDGGPERLGYAVRQASLLHQPGRDSVRGVLLLDTAGRLHVFPKSAREVAVSVAPATFLFTAEPGGTLTGHSLAFSRGDELVAKPVWTVRLTDRITAIVGKSPLERVHSQGRVLGDRSVLYKYVNPNLVAVVTEATDAVHKFVTSVYLLDVVSGSVVFSTVHRRARGPVHLVHSENWVVYTYFSDKFRRTELVALELYEGKVQSNTTAFSSVSTPLQPIVDRQAFILPSHVQSMKETITEKGITSKHILVALASGWVLELPWVFVDPRRPSTVTPEMREEGVIPYMPELPLPSDSVINYNQTLERVRGIHTSPSGLESTCLVLVYGLDVFYTRVAPSKTFDLLKEDFDYYLITVVLSALLIASYVTKKLASKKALKQAWK
ncbi:ER membrane protein complex subunit 1 isoform X2 [Bacillus rossius redtenbacheri]